MTKAIGAAVLVLTGAICRAEPELPDRASDPGFVAAYRADAIAMARRKSRALGVSAPGARVSVGPRIATGGKFTGHYLWDIAFSAFWAVHTAPGELPLTSSLDNLYRFAEPDGYIGREFYPDGTPTWSPQSPFSFNPPMLSWAELEIADSAHAEVGRLERVYPALVRHHRAYSGRFRRPDGLYFSNGLGCGMDDLPRWPRGMSRERLYEGGLRADETWINPRARGMWKRWVGGGAPEHSWNRQIGWIDMSCAAALDMRSLAEIARRIGRPDEAAGFERDYRRLADAINRLCWDEKTGFYYDVGESGLIFRRHLGALWALVSHVAPPDRAKRMIDTLFDPEVFYRPVPLASLEKGDPDYTSEKEYFKGPAWPNLNFLAIRGLLEYGHRKHAEKLARRWYNCCAELYVKTGGVYENVSSEQFDHPKNRAAPDYAGHACLTPIALPAMFGWGRRKTVSPHPVADGPNFDFAGPHGEKCRLTNEGPSLWRLRTAVDGAFPTEGAAQALARWMSETNRVELRTLAAAEKDGAWEVFAKDGSSVRLENRPFRLQFKDPAGTVVLDVGRIDSGRFSSGILGRLAENEGVYGLGSRFDALNRRGRTTVLYTGDGWNDSKSTYLAVPLFQTTRGGGLFVNAYDRLTADFGDAKPDVWRLEIERGGLDVYISASGRMGDAITRYHELTGRPEVPADWQQDHVVCRYAPDLTVLEGPTSRVMSGHRCLGWGVSNIVERYRSIGVRPSAMILEGWDADLIGKSGAETSERIRRLTAATDYLRKEGVRALVWMRCGSTLMRAEGFRPEYLVSVDVTDDNGVILSGKQKGVPDVGGGANPDVGNCTKAHEVLDITNPEAWRWYVDVVWGKLLSCGVAGAKIDFCEEMPDDNMLYGQRRIRYHWQDPSVFAHAAVHHAYPVFFISKLRRELSRKLGNGGFMVLARGGGIGSQRNPFMWAGDQVRSMEKLDDQLLAVLTAGMSGVPFMTFDAAGYQYGKLKYDAVGVWHRTRGTYDFSRCQTGPGEEAVCVRRDAVLGESEEARVFLRGAAFAAWMPCLQTHGFVRNPYDFDSSTRESFCKLVARHGKLLPMFGEAAKKAAVSGVPPVRPLVFDYPEDLNVRSLSDEYLLGDSWLVAPILSDSDVRKVYLPCGRWKCVRTNRCHVAGPDGLWLEETVPPGELAVYARQEK